MKHCLRYLKISAMLILLSTGKALPQLNCLTGHFYMIGNYASGGRAIYPVTMNGSSLSVNLAQAVPAGNNSSLAIANPDGLGSTFWTSGYNPITINKYNGSSWVTVWTDTSSSTIPLSNAAGNGQYLYYHTGKAYSWPNRIVRYDGNTAITIWQDTTVYSNVADIAVDDSGNVYFFTGATPYDVTDLNIMSPSGVMLATIPLSMSIDAIWTFGAFFDNNILWLPFGSSNLNFPNQVAPITITPTVASFGNPVNIPTYTIGSGPNGPLYLTFVDAASCGSAVFPFLTTGLSTISSEHAIVAPNPATDNIRISFPDIQHRKIQLYDLTGHLLADEACESSQFAMDISHLQSGIYLLSLREGNASEYIKICKE